MSFDREQIEEDVALNRIHPIQKLAWDALEAELDGPSIRRLAALENPNGFEVDQLLPKALEEMGLRRLSRAEAAERVACRLARKALLPEDDPLNYTEQLEKLWGSVAEDCSSEMNAFGCLHEDVFVARNQNQPEDEIRDWLRRSLKELLPACESGNA